MRRVLWLMSLALVGCVSEDATVTKEQLLVGEGRDTVLRFTMNGFTGNSFEYSLDVSAWTMNGVRVEPPAASRFSADPSARYSVPTATPLPAAARATLEAELRQVKTIELPPDQCVPDGINYDGDFPEVELEGRTYSTWPRECDALLPGAVDLSAALRAAFDSLAPTRELVQWNGHEYEAI